MRWRGLPGVILIAWAAATVLLAAPGPAHAGFFATRRALRPTDPPRTRPAEAAPALALSADGTTAVIGSPGGEENVIRVFRRSPTGAWAQAGPAIHPTGEHGAGSFGFSVAISADGGTIAVGAPEDGEPGPYPGEADATGAVWIFARVGSRWVQQAGPLQPADLISPVEGIITGTAAQFGISVALSADGDTLLAGAPRDRCAQCGAAWVYRRTGTTWAQAGAGFSPVAGAPQLFQPRAPQGGFGTSVSLSADGTRAVIGDPDAVAPGAPTAGRARAGAAWVYALSGDTATVQTRLAPPAHSPPHRAPAAVISGNGQEILVTNTARGHQGYKSQPFVLRGGRWATQGPPLPGAVSTIDAAGTIAVTDGGVGDREYDLSRGRWQVNGPLFASYQTDGAFTLAADGSFGLVSDQQARGDGADVYTRRNVKPVPAAATGTITGLASGHPTITLNAAPGPAIGSIGSLTLTLPLGLAFTRAAVHAVATPGVRHEASLPGYSLILVMRQAPLSMRVRIPPGAVTESAALRRRAARRPGLTVTLRVLLSGPGLDEEHLRARLTPG